jgi:hypothetical protein
MELTEHYEASKQSMDGKVSEKFSQLQQRILAVKSLGEGSFP